MNLRDLEYFVAVAETGRFSLAADKCHVSQPTLSGQLKKLEDELGQSLFDRDTRSLRLTGFGQEALGLARSALDKVRELEYRARELGDPFHGPVSLGAFPTLAPWLLPRLTPLFSSGCPDSEFFLVEEKTNVLQARLASGELDAAFLALPQDQPGLESIEVFQEDFLVTVSSAHPWARRTSLEPAELQGTELLLLADGHCLRDQTLDLCRRYGAREKGQFRATGLETLRQMVRLGTGITLMPRLAIPPVPEADIAYIPVSGPGFQRCIGLCFRPTHPRRVLFLHLIGLVRGLCGQSLPVTACGDPD